MEIRTDLEYVNLNVICHFEMYSDVFYVGTRIYLNLTSTDCHLLWNNLTFVQNNK
jgi:hypothetical protein